MSADLPDTSASGIPTLLTAREAARALRISERTLWDLTMREEVAVLRIGRGVLNDAADLTRWIQARKVGAEVSHG